MRIPALLLIGLAASFTAFAAEPKDQPPPKVPPDLPNEPTGAPSGIQPEVTIIKRGGSTIQEYRVHGHLYMVKITPSHGAPYYLIDTNGDGRLETYRGDLKNPNIIQWKLFQW